MACLFPMFNWDGTPFPCGKCPPCLNRRIDGWIFRLSCEERVSDSVYWVRLSYDDDHLKFAPCGRSTIFKRDIQLWLKRLRSMQPRGSTPLKYFGCGEYGTISQRPHYHFFVFNLRDPADLELAWHDSDGCLIGQTYVDPRPMSPGSIGYTCGYMNKKKIVPISRFDTRTPEFLMMSKGLGRSYISDDTLDYHHRDLRNTFVTLPSGQRSAMPRYLQEKIFPPNLWNIATRLPVSEVIQSNVIPAVAASQAADFRSYVQIHGDGCNYLRDKSAARIASIVNSQKSTILRKDY